MSGSELSIEFCGEWYRPPLDGFFTVGRAGDLVVDENPYLHRRLLEFRHDQGLWTVVNVGDRISATLTDTEGLMLAELRSGARLPIVLPKMRVTFSAGPTTYELLVLLAESPFRGAVRPSHEMDGTVTMGAVRLTPDQRRCIVALAEPALRRGGTGATQLPKSRDAADRLGWTTTRFNRKLDNVCDKLARAGVKGLQGDADDLAANRRARLVEYSLAARIVTPSDLELLDA